MIIRRMLKLLSTAAAAGVACVVLAQTQIPPDPQVDPRPGEPPVPGMPDTRPDRPGEEPAQLPPPPPGPPAPESEGPAEEEPAPTPLDETEDGQSMRSAGAAGMFDVHRASQVIGKSVQTPAGETIGGVRDVVLDRDGKATHVIVAYTAAEDESTRLTAVPWETLARLTRGDHIVMERSHLQSAPSFTASTLPDFSSSEWSRQTDRYWLSIRSAAGDPARMR